MPDVERATVPTTELNVTDFLEHIHPVAEVSQAIDERPRELKSLTELMKLARARDRRLVQQQQQGANLMGKTFKVQQIAEIFQVGQHTVLTWIKSGELQATDISCQRGGKPRWRISESALAAFELARTASPTPRRFLVVADSRSSQLSLKNTASHTVGSSSDVRSTRCFRWAGIVTWSPGFM